MSDQGHTSDGGSLPADDAGNRTIEAYETDRGVVLYDAENPLAWIETTRSYPIDEQA